MIYEYYSGKNTLKQIVPAFPSRYQLNYTWDLNGNLVSQSPTGMMLDFERLCWNESNRISFTLNNDYAAYYAYDFIGERTYKLRLGKSMIYINGSNREGYAHDNSVLYSSPYLVANDKGYTKHIFAGSERIASKPGGGGLSDINRNNNSLTEEINAKKDAHNTLFERSKDCLISPFELVALKKNSLRILYNFINFVSMETDIYYYHSDHLGSSSWITSTNGSPIQYMQYHPFGETNIDQRAGDWNARYTFSGKEKDEERRSPREHQLKLICDGEQTGYHYFETRYYNSSLGIWLSVDPMAGKYPGLSPYVYCANNPVILRDPDGKKIVPTNNEGNTAISSYLDKFNETDVITNVFELRIDGSHNKSSDHPVYTSNSIKGIDRYSDIKTF